MLKSPKSKDVKKVLIALLSFELGRRFSNGVVGLMPENIDPNHAKAGATGASILGAITYNGPKKDIAQPFLIGMAAQQGGELLDKELRPLVQTDNQFIKDIAGLNGENGCGCGTSYTYPHSLGAPEVPGIIDMRYNEMENHFEEVPSLM